MNMSSLSEKFSNEVLKRSIHEVSDSSSGEQGEELGASLSRLTLTSRNINDEGPPPKKRIRSDDENSGRVGN